MTKVPFKYLSSAIKHYNLLALMLLLSSFTVQAEFLDNQNKSREIYLIRHAEKQNDGTHNPSLTKVGQLRANNIKMLLKEKGIAQIYSTMYNRTMQTAEPLAKELKLKIKNYDPSELSLFSETILEQKGSILIVGHSNTTPNLARLLGGQNIPDIKETEYGGIFQLIIKNDNNTVETVLLSSNELQ